MAGVPAALKADDNVGLRRQNVRDFSFSLIAPVGAYNRFYH
jgi:hypothetical protein